MAGRCWSRAILPMPTIARRCCFMPLQRLDGHAGCSGLRQAVTQWESERRRFDLEHIAWLSRHAIGERKRRRAEEMHMHVAGPAEQRILEVVMFEVPDRVRHVGLAREERFLPQQLAA